MNVGLDPIAAARVHATAGRVVDAEAPPQGRRTPHAKAGMVYEEAVFGVGRRPKGAGASAGAPPSEPEPVPLSEREAVHVAVSRKGSKIFCCCSDRTGFLVSAGLFAVIGLVVILFAATISGVLFGIGLSLGSVALFFAAFRQDDSTGTVERATLT